MSNPLEWHKYVDKVQHYLNSSFNRSINRSPYELMVGINMKLKDDLKLKELLQAKIVANFES